MTKDKKNVLGQGYSSPPDFENVGRMGCCEQDIDSRAFRRYLQMILLHASNDITTLDISLDVAVDSKKSVVFDHVPQW